MTYNKMTRNGMTITVVKYVAIFTFLDYTLNVFSLHKKYAVLSCNKAKLFININSIANANINHSNNSVYIFYKLPPIVMNYNKYCLLFFTAHTTIFIRIMFIFTLCKFFYLRNFS